MEALLESAVAEKDLHVKDLIDYEKCAKALKVIFPDYSIVDIALAIRGHFQGTCLWEQDVVYNRSQAQEFVARLLAEFAAEFFDEPRANFEGTISEAESLIK